MDYKRFKIQLSNYEIGHTQGGLSRGRQLLTIKRMTNESIDYSDCELYKRYKKDFHLYTFAKFNAKVVQKTFKL